MDKKITAEHLSKAIHRHCIQCQGQNQSKVESCDLMNGCPLWIYRNLGKEKTDD